MKAIVDQETCIGCGLCPTICPEVFCMECDVAEVCGEVTDENKDSVQEAVDSCPVSAITME